VYKIDRNVTACPTALLERAFPELLLNFTWWSTARTFQGNNVFEGGFLGLDKLGVFDRSAPLPAAGAWSSRMAPRGWPCTASTWRPFALELSADNPA